MFQRLACLFILLDYLIPGRKVGLVDTADCANSDAVFAWVQCTDTLACVTIGPQFLEAFVKLINWYPQSVFNHQISIHNFKILTRTLLIVIVCYVKCG